MRVAHHPTHEGELQPLCLSRREDVLRSDPVFQLVVKALKWNRDAYQEGSCSAPPPLDTDRRYNRGASFCHIRYILIESDQSAGAKQGRRLVLKACRNVYGSCLPSRPASARKVSVQQPLLWHVPSERYVGREVKSSNWRCALELVAGSSAIVNQLAWSSVRMAIPVRTESMPHKSASQQLQPRSRLDWRKMPGEGSVKDSPARGRCAGSERPWWKHSSADRGA